MDTDNCARLSGNLSVFATANGCRINDSFDGTLFRKDAGGWAVKFELYVGSTLVAKTEFHPYGERLLVYDTRDDCDTIYASLAVEEFGPFYGPYRGPVNGYNAYNFALDEGTAVTIDVCDDYDKLDCFGISPGHCVTASSARLVRNRDNSRNGFGPVAKGESKWVNGPVELAQSSSPSLEPPGSGQHRPPR